MDSITQYLQDKSGGYRRGIALLKTVHGRGADIAELSAFADRPFAPTWAERKLMEILRGYASPPTPKGGDVIATAHVLTPPLGVGGADPEIIALLRSEEYQLREDRRTLHFGLEETEDEDVRAEKVLTIRSLSERIDACWSKIDAYTSEGILPVADVAKNTEGVLSAFDLQRKLLSIRPRLSKLKSLLENDDLPESKRIRYTREMSEKTIELASIEKQLSA